MKHVAHNGPRRLGEERRSETALHARYYRGGWICTWRITSRALAGCPLDFRQNRSVWTTTIIRLLLTPSSPASWSIHHSSVPSRPSRQATQLSSTPLVLSLERASHSFQKAFRQLNPPIRPRTPASTVRHFLPGEHARSIHPHYST
jgi:hypothetical protein